MHVEHLFIYPIKSLGGIELKEVHLEARGFKYDRRYMLVDEKGVFITQRDNHLMALFHTYIEKDGIRVSFREELRGDSVLVPYDLDNNKTRQVQIWQDTCSAVEMSDEVNEYFSERLSQKCFLVYMPDNTNRLVDKRYAQQDEMTSFADAFPILLIGSASLNDLNARLPKEEQVVWNRFRPNLVVKTEVPFEEDNWQVFKLGNAILQCVKPCARCVITTINQESGLAGKEPLKTLASYRTQNHKVMFGQNVLIKSYGLNLRVGDEFACLKD